MGALLKLVDASLFMYFSFFSIAAPLIDSQTVLPAYLFPSVLSDIKTWYVNDFNDYLFIEKPHFCYGIIWIELLFQYPLALASAYGIANGKSWSNTTCLIYGVTFVTSMVTILSELVLSNKASDKLLMMYFPFLGFGLLALFRGVLSLPGMNISNGETHVLLDQKKKI